MPKALERTLQVIGIVNAGLLVLGDAHADSATRYSYPIDESFPTKFFDLDRCFLVERLPVANGNAQNIDAGFQFSDHNPVLLTFQLL